MMKNSKNEIKKFIIVDLFSGTYNINNYGHELFNEFPNALDGRYYGYVPDLDNPNIDKLGAKKTDSYVDNILVIFVKKITAKNTNRIITGFYPNARVYRKKVSGEKINRSFPDKDGNIKHASYSLESDQYIKIDLTDSFIIETKKYNPYMFRKQRVYSGNYDNLDNKILEFIDKYMQNDMEDDLSFQRSVEKSFEASTDTIINASLTPVKEEVRETTNLVRRDPRLTKSALKKANYKCEIDQNHLTFIDLKGNSFMEGHHLIPVTLNNSNDIWKRFSRNIDCLENIVSLCPNCHRKIHFSNPSERKEMIVNLFNLRKDKLSEVEIKITLDQLLIMYGISD